MSKDGLGFYLVATIFRVWGAILCVTSVSKKKQNLNLTFEINNRDVNIYAAHEAWGWLL